MTHPLRSDHPSIAAGVDLGGTKIAVGWVDESARVLSRATAPTPAHEGPAAILETVVDCLTTSWTALPDELRKITPSGVGIGSAGVIDPSSARVVSATSALSDWAGTPLREELQTRLAERALGIGGLGAGVAQKIEAVNDVHAHALGEAWAGAAAGADTALLVAFGTGIGGSLILEGRPFGGAHHVAGHLGHVPSQQAHGIRCTCGSTGHLEAIASGPAILRAYRRKGGDPAVPDTRALCLRAVSGADALAFDVVRTAAQAAGEALAGFANAMDPDVLVISGGLPDAGALWWDPAVEAFSSGLIEALRDVRLVPAALGGDAAVVGAASLVLRSLNPTLEETP